MSQVFHKLSRPLTSPAFDVKLGQFACYFTATLILVLGVQKVCRLPLDETELFFGLLLVLAVVLSCVLIGLVLPMSVQRKIET